MRSYLKNKDPVKRIKRVCRRGLAGVLACLMLITTMVYFDDNLTEAQATTTGQETAYALINSMIGRYKFNYTGNTNHYTNWGSGNNPPAIKHMYRDVAIGSDCSTATLTQTSGASGIVKAFLVWETRAKAPTQAVFFAGPGENHNKWIYPDYAVNDVRVNGGTTYKTMYCMAADVTSAVQQWGYGTYLVANIPYFTLGDGGDTGGGESPGSWQLIVVEQGNDFPVRALSLGMMSRYKQDVPLEASMSFGNGIKTKASGNVTGQFFFGASCANDYVMTENIAAYNSSGAYIGTAVSNKTPSAGLYRNGALVNSRDFGRSEQNANYNRGSIRMDLSDVSNIGNNATSIKAYVQHGSWSTFFLLGAAVDISTPTFTATQTTATEYNGNVYVRGTTKNTSSTANTGVYNGQMQVVLDAALNPYINECTLTVNGSGSGVSASCEKVNGQYIVTFSGGTLNSVMTGDYIDYAIPCKIDSTSTLSYYNRDYFSGFIRSEGINTNIWASGISQASSRGNGKKYTVAFDGNGATSGSMSDVSYLMGYGYTLPLNGYKRGITVNYDGNGGTSEKSSEAVNSTFNGWLDENDFNYNGTVYSYHAFSGPYYANKYSDLKAALGYNKYALVNHWVTHTLAGTETRQSSPTFDMDYYKKNAGLQDTYGDDNSAYAIHYGTSGYEAGLKGAASEDTETRNSYEDRASVANLSMLDGEKLTLKAEWQDNTTVLPNATRYGYTLEGWYDADGNKVGNAGDVYAAEENLHDAVDLKWYISGQGQKGITAGTTVDLYYAVNVPATVNCRLYDANGAYLKTLMADKKVGTNDQVVRWDTTGLSAGMYRVDIYGVDDLGNTISWHRYFSVGTNADYTGYDFGKKTVNSSPAVTLTAKWTKTTYKVTLKKDTGIDKVESDGFTTLETFVNDAYLKILHRGVDASGYSTFGKAMLDSSTENDAVRLVTALAKSSEYQNKFSTAGTSYTNTPDKNTQNNPYQLVADCYRMFLRRNAGADEVKFWVTNAWNVRTSTSDGIEKIVSGIGNSKEASLNLPKAFAFDPDTKQVLYDTTDTGTYIKYVQAGTDVTVTATASDGYVFSKWEGTPEELGSTDNPYTFTMPESDVTLTATAVEKAKSYTVSFEPNGGEGTMDDVSIPYDEPTGLPANKFTKTGYHFDEWKDQDTGNTYGDKEDITIASDSGRDHVTLEAQWEANTYTVEYDGNGATGGSTASSSHTYDEAKELTENGFEKTGYTFSGWNTKADGSGTSYQDKEKVKNLTDKDEDTVTLYAQWTPEEIKVTFHRNTSSSDTVTAEQTFTYDVAGQKFSDKRWKRTGYTLSGWSFDQDASEKTYDVLMDVTNGWIASYAPGCDLYAVWIPDDGTAYTVNHYTKDLGKDTYSLESTESRTGRTGSTVTASDLRKDIKGFTYEKAQVGGQDITTATVLADGSLVVDLYYTRNRHTVTLDKGTGIKDVTGAGTYEYGEKVTIDAALETGYKWVKWTGTKETAEKKHTFTMGDEDVTETAVAAAITYTVSYDGNGPTGGSTASSSHTYNVPSKLTPNGYEKTGYTFTGWNTKPDGKERAYGDQEVVENLTVIDGDTITMYAQWTPNDDTEYVVNHYLRNLESADYTLQETENKKGTTDTIITLADLKKDYTGFTYEKAQADGADATEATIHGDGSLVVDLYYTRNTYSVTLNKGEGIDAVYGAGSYEYGASVTIGASVAADYTWNSWSGTHNTEHQTYTFTMPAGDVTETANATRNKPVDYFISYDLNGGTLEQDNPTSYNAETPTFTLNNPSKTGYEFAGWTGICGDTPQVTVTVAQGTTGDLTFKAEWTPITYTIHFDGNGATSGETPDVDGTYDEDVTLPENGYTRTTENGDSTFIGWSTDPDSRTPEYMPGDTVKNLTSEKDSTVIMYAIWDDCPDIEAGDLYYSLKQAQSGFITDSELLSHATAKDPENGQIAAGTHEDGSSFTVMDYLPEDFTGFTHEGSVTETYYVVDTAGNTYQKQITVYIVDTEAKEAGNIGTTRFINEKYYGKSFENGGLQDTSRWLTDAGYVAAITKSFDNLNNNTPEQTYHFTHEQVLEMKQFIRDNGIGNTQSPEALSRFYDQFMR